MAAAKALLRATVFLEKSTATEHATSSLAQHGDQTVHSTHTRLRRWRRPSGGADAPGAGYDLRWEDITLWGEILEGQN